MRNQHAAHLKLKGPRAWRSPFEFCRPDGLSDVRVMRSCGQPMLRAPWRERTYGEPNILATALATKLRIAERSALQQIHSSRPVCSGDASC